MNKVETNNNQYWLNRWQNNDIENFSQESPNEFLVKHFSKLKTTSSSTCLMPMCGSSIDILFFLSKGIKVVGVELSEKAVISFFTENRIKYEVIEENGYKYYKGEDVVIYVSDIFNLPGIVKSIPTFDIWYDRGAYIALPKDLRAKYAKMMLEVCSDKTQILLLVMEHDKDPEIQTPPFSASESELIYNFSPNIKFKLIDSELRDNIPDYRKAEGMTFQYYKTYIRE